MIFHVVTLFPEALESYLQASILGRAIKSKKIAVKFCNPRDFVKPDSTGRRPVDDKPFGGGAGMVLRAAPILKAVASLKLNKKPRSKIILLSAKGKPFNQKLASDWAKKYEQLVFISGRYEGIDERVRTILKAEEVSIGPYVLTDGDVAAMVVISAVARLVPGVIRLESLAEESHRNLLLEYPHYTRPEVLIWRGKNYRVPKVLLSGHHARIDAWRQKHSPVDNPVIVS